MQMEKNSITALLDWVDLVKMALPELEKTLQQRLELEHEHDHVSADLKQTNRAHAAELDKKIMGIIDLYKEDLDVHTARITL